MGEEINNEKLDVLRDELNEVILEFFEGLSDRTKIRIILDGLSNIVDEII